MLEEMPRIQWFPGHMKKTERLIKDHLSQVDAVVEIRDARIPYSSGNPLLKKMIQHKPQIVLLNKSDLSDPEANQRWISYFKEKSIPALLVNGKTGEGLSQVIPAIDRALQKRREQRESRGMTGTFARVMAVGIPNVGKSTFINAMSGGKPAQVENRPGVTRDKQWVRIGNQMDLLDMPGVLWPKFETPLQGLHLAYTGAIKEDVFDIEEVAAWLLKDLAKIYPSALEKRYHLHLNETENPYEMLEALGKNRGMRVRGGEIDTERASRLLMKEFQSGMLGRITLENPPNFEKRDNHDAL